MRITKDSYFKFSGGEVHLKVRDIPDNAREIICLDYSMDGFMAVCEYNQLLRADNRILVDLIYPYLPYARQDRWIAPGEPFSLRTFADLINQQKFNKVTIWDPHSDVAPALINNCVTWDQDLLARQIIPAVYFTDRNTIFVSPDAGAYKKVSKLMPDDLRIAIGTKHRDAQGNVTGTNVFCPTDLKGTRCVIVDDICDGGRTFIELAKVLRQRGAREIILYVTHGIFSKGLEVFDGIIDHIYTTNSFNHSHLKFHPSLFTIVQII